MKKNILRLLLAISFILCVGNVYAQHRYYCEIKGIEKEL